MLTDSGEWIDKMEEAYGIDLDNFTNKALGKVIIFNKALNEMGAAEAANEAWKNSPERAEVIKNINSAGNNGYSGKTLMEAEAEYKEQYVKNLQIETDMASTAAEFEKLHKELAGGLSASLTGTDYSEEAAKLWEAYESALVKEFAENQVRVKLGVDASVDDYGKAMDAEYYSEMRKALNNEIKIYKSKANTTTEEGLQYTQKLREAQVKLNNLDDEEIQDKIDLLKLQGANLNAIT